MMIFLNVVTLQSYIQLLPQNIHKLPSGPNYTPPTKIYLSD